jgi:hypothetical protein
VKGELRQRIDSTTLRPKSTSFSGGYKDAARRVAAYRTSVLLAALVSGSRGYLQQVFAVHFIDVVNDLGIRARHRF